MKTLTERKLAIFFLTFLTLIHCKSFKLIFREKIFPPAVSPLKSQTHVVTFTAHKTESSLKVSHIPKTILNYTS